MSMYSTPGTVRASGLGIVRPFVQTIVLSAAIVTALCPAIADTPESRGGATQSGPVLAGAGGSVSTTEVPASQQPRLRLSIAVDQFKWTEVRDDINRIPADVREGMNVLLVEKLQRSGYFQVMDREATTIEQARVESQIDKEKRAKQDAGTGYVRPSRQTLTAAAFIITPTVTGVQVSGGGDNGFGLGGIVTFGGKSAEVTLSLNIRILDSQTGAILDSQTIDAKQKTGGKGLVFNLGAIHGGQDSVKQTPYSKVVEEALDKAVTQVCQRLSKEPWSALVAAQDKTTGRVIINAGTESGVTPGMEFVVYRAGDAVLNPETGDVLTRGDEVRMGRLRVARLQRNAAFCDVLEGTNFEPKNIVRPASAGAATLPGAP